MYTFQIPMELTLPNVAKNCFPVRLKHRAPVNSASTISHRNLLGQGLSFEKISLQHNIASPQNRF